MNVTTTRARPIGALPLPTPLRRALDPAHIRQTLGAALDVAVASVTVDRVLFSSSRPVIIHYRFALDGVAEPLIAIGELIGERAAEHLAAERLRLAKSRRAQLDRQDQGALALLADPGIVLRRPGLDAKIDGLRLLHDDELAAALIERCLGWPADETRTRLSLKAHRLGKRAVLAADVETRDGASRSFFLRLRPTTGDEGAAAFDRHARIAESLAFAEHVRLPSALHFDAEWGAAIYSALRGHAPDLVGDRAEHDGLLVGRALREWRNLAPADGREWHARDEIGGLRQWSGRLREHLPELADRFDRALERVSEDLVALPRVAPRACHRDFHEGQLLLDGASCGLLDFDTWCAADPALDIGNLAAHVRLRELRTGRSARKFEHGFVAMASMGAYPGVTRHVSAWKRAALLRLAAIYAFTSEPETTIHELMTEAGR